jgi:hypothetical protein
MSVCFRTDSDNQFAPGLTGERGWQWQPHDVDLKGIGNERLWSLVGDDWEVNS